MGSDGLYGNRCWWWTSVKMLRKKSLKVLEVGIVSIPSLKKRKKENLKLNHLSFLLTVFKEEETKSKYKIKV